MPPCEGWLADFGRYYRKEKRAASMFRSVDLQHGYFQGRRTLTQRAAEHEYCLLMLTTSVSIVGTNKLFLLF